MSMSLCSILLAYFLPTDEKYLANSAAISLALYVWMLSIFRYSMSDGCCQFLGIQ